jgi:thiosulfate dehydrogenase
MKKGIAAVVTSALWVIIFSCNHHQEKKNQAPSITNTIVFDSSKVPHTPYGRAVLYGRELVMNTAKYIGPDGLEGKYATNKMSCQDCHQDGGLKPNSFSLVLTHDVYPQYRAREGKVLSLAERINNCINRPLNGRSLPLDIKEMIAFLSYLRYINNEWGNDTIFKEKREDSLTLPDMAASPERGAVLYQVNCSRCHGVNGSGLLNGDKSGYLYPPLWGDSSYQAGSSMHRVIKLAGWMKYNMPFDKALPGKPFLTNQQALDIAAFINDDDLHKRPVNDRVNDYPDIKMKPVDYEKGPYVDSFSQKQHKYGPYPPIIKYLKEHDLRIAY